MGSRQLLVAGCANSSTQGSARMWVAPGRRRMV